MLKDLVGITESTYPLAAVSGRHVLATSFLVRHVFSDFAIGPTLVVSLTLAFLACVGIKFVTAALGEANELILDASWGSNRKVCSILSTNMQ